MNKKNILVSILILLIIIIIWIIINKINKNIEKKEIQNNTIETNIKKTTNKNTEWKITISENASNKIKDVKNIEEEIEETVISENEQNNDNLSTTYKINELINQGNSHLNNNEYILALGKYIKANKKDKNNPKIIEKISETFFSMKEWEKAYKNYNKLHLLNYENKDYINNYILSNLNSAYTTWIKTYSWVINDINKLNINQELKFYYTNSIYCIIDFDKCESTFYNYVSNSNFNWELKELVNIKQAFINYENFQYKEEYYKKTLLIGEFFKKDLYPVVIILGERILENKKWYKPILKMLAQSYYEIWNIERTKKYLLEYNNIDNKDPDVSYLLWLVYQKLHDYLLSNIFLSKAIKLGYKSKSNIYKIQVYNSYILKDDKKILTYLNKLIESQETPKYNGLILATYFNIIKWNIEKAEVLTKLWLQIYPEKEDFYWFDWYIKLKNLEYWSAEKSLQTWYKINSENAFLNMAYWLFKAETWDNIKAMIYFKKALKLDLWWEISKISSKELEKIEKDNSNQSIPLKENILE